MNFNVKEVIGLCVGCLMIGAGFVGMYYEPKLNDLLVEKNAAEAKFKLMTFIGHGLADANEQLNKELEELKTKS